MSAPEGPQQGSYSSYDLRPYENGLGDKLSRARDWFVPKRLIIGAAIIVAIVIALGILLVTGNLTAFYDWLIGWTTAGEPWTHIMRRNPWIFGIFAAVALLGLFFLPKLAVGRLYIIFTVFLVGFLGGHIFW